MRTLSAMSISVSGIVRKSYLSILVLQIDKEIKNLGYVGCHKRYAQNGLIGSLATDSDAATLTDCAYALRMWTPY